MKYFYLLILSVSILKANVFINKTDFSDNDFKNFIESKKYNIELIEDEFKLRGYLDFSYNSQNDSIFIYSGKQFTINNVSYFGNKMYFDKNQLDKVIEDFLKLKFSTFKIENIIAKLLDFYNQKGFPFCKINVNRIVKNKNSIDIVLNIDSGKYIDLYFINFTGNKTSKTETLLKEGRFPVLPQKFSPGILKNSANYLMKSGMFIDFPTFAVTKNRNLFGLICNVNEAKYNSIDAIIGYSSNNSNENESEGQFKGRAELKFKNIFGTFRQAQISWFRKDNDNESILIYYQEPSLYIIPIKLGLTFSQDYYAKEYLERKYEIDSEYMINLNYDLLLGYDYKTFFPDSIFEENGYLKSSSMKYSVGFKYSDIFNKYELVAGKEIMLKMAGISSSEEGGDAYFSKEISSYLIYIYKIYKNLYFKFDLKYEELFFDNNYNINRTYDEYKLGGISTVRGYFEDQFKTTKYVLNNSKIQFKINRDTGFYIFLDVAGFDYSNTFNYIYGSGAGLTYSIPYGKVEINYAIPLEEGITNSKIHFRYINEF